MQCSEKMNYFPPAAIDTCIHKNFQIHYIFSRFLSRCKHLPNKTKETTANEK